MKQKLLIALLTLTCSAMNACGMSDASARTTSNNDGNKAIVVYFSCTNRTGGIAGQIAEITNGELRRIVPETPYTAADLDYNDPSSRANREQNDASARPAISGKIGNIADYDTVFIGYPIWWGKAPKIIFTFLESHELSGKTVIPFCTSGSSGIGSSDTDLHGSAPEAQWKAGRRFGAGAAKKEIAEWIESMSTEKVR